MADPFRKRGVKVLVETLEAAEFDIEGYQISEKDVAVVGNSLKTLPISLQDRFAGPVRVRTLKGYDVAFLLTREGHDMVVTIGAVRPFDPQSPLETKLKNLDLVATFRGALGI